MADKPSANAPAQAADRMTLRRSLSTRHGRKVQRHLYWQRGPEPADDDPPVGMVDTPELAALVVAAVNTWASPALASQALESLQRLQEVRGG